ncbi:MAG: CHASE2 domain-containing protein, partial [Gammaproteobacteria bacterium]|nr:CHASE2 domain-containing protein [Gammaproteobacteria bacterium]
MTLSPRQRFQLETSLFFAASLVFVAAAVYWGWFRSADRWFYDALIKTMSAPLTEDVIIVGIDDQSLENYGPWPWPRAQQAKLLAAVGAAKPRAIFLDVVFAGQSQASDDAALVSAASSIDTLALPIIIDAVANQAQLIEVLPFPDLLEQTDVTGHAHVELDGDAIVRGTYLYQGIGEARWPHVALALAEHLGSLPEPIHRCSQVSDEFSIQNRRCGYVYSPFVGPPGSFPEVSALAVLRSTNPLEALEGHIVFIGMVASGTTDLVTTPVSGESRPMSGVEYNANLYNALVQNQLKRDAPLLWIYLINLVCVSIPVLILPRLKAKGMLGFALLCALIPAATMAVTLVSASLWLPLASAALICLLSYPYWSWRRHEVAWQFIEAEIVRLENERARWDLDDKDDRPHLELQRLQDFLGAELIDQPTGWLPDGTDSIDVSL